MFREKLGEKIKQKKRAKGNERDLCIKWAVSVPRNRILMRLSLIIFVTNFESHFSKEAESQAKTELLPVISIDEPWLRREVRKETFSSRMLFQTLFHARELREDYAKLVSRDWLVLSISGD